MLPEGCCFPFLRHFPQLFLQDLCSLYVATASSAPRLRESVCDLAQSSITAEVQQHRLSSSTLLGVVSDNIPQPQNN